MSFSKAKLHRFNDEIHCAPPPGTYNPEIINKSVGPVIYKTERFNENKRSNLCSSTESLNSLIDKVDSCRHSCFTFKTPKHPMSTFRSVSNTDVRRKMEFTQKKAASTEQINKNDVSDYEVSSLKYGLNMIQEELSIEKNRTEKLLRELTRWKKDQEQAEQFTETMIQVFLEKNNIIDALKEKNLILQAIVSESFDSYHKHVCKVYSIFQTYSNKSCDSEREYSKIIERYQSLICEYEKDFENINTFLADLLRKQNKLEYDRLALEEPRDVRVNRLVESLKTTEKEIRKYELVVRGMQRVINVLSGRILESDREVEKKNEEMKTLTMEKEKLTAALRDKEEEILTMRDTINNVAENLFDQVHSKEKDLLNLVDTFKKKAMQEKDSYDSRLSEKNEKIFELLAEKNQIDLELQEAIDQIDMLKCKEETLTKMLEQIRGESASKLSQMEDELNECRRKLFNWRTFSEGTGTAADVAIKSENFDFLENVGKKIESGKFANQRVKAVAVTNNCGLVNFIRRLLEFIPADVIHSTLNDHAFDIERFAGDAQREISSETVASILINFHASYSNDDAYAWLRHLLNVVYGMLETFENENATLKSDLARLRNDFIEKCDECAQLTRFLRVSEKNVEFNERKSNELESCQNDWQLKYSRQCSETEVLKKQLSFLEQRLSEEVKRTETLHYQKNTALDTGDRLAELENSLKQECQKSQSLEKQNSKLQKLIGPYRQHLDKYEMENKCLSANNDPVLFEKYSKILNQQNQKQKVKQIIKLRNDVKHLKKIVISSPKIYSLRFFVALLFRLYLWIMQLKFYTVENGLGFWYMRRGAKRDGLTVEPKCNAKRTLDRVSPHSSSNGADLVAKKRRTLDGNQ